MSIVDALNAGGGVNGLLDPGGTAQALQRALEQQVANLRAGVNPSNSPSLGAAGGQAPLDPFQALQQQLYQQINSIPSYSTPIDQLRKQAQSQVNAQYDPQIAQLLGTMRGEKTRSARNQGDAKNMYGSLAKDLASQIPGITNQMHQAQNQAGQRYDQAQQQSQGDYQQQANQQQAILQQLGIQSAQQATQAQSQDDQNYFRTQEGLQKNQALDALQQQGNADTSYQRNISNSSQMAGDNAVQGLRNQLNDYLNTANTQLGSLQSQKASGIESVLQQLINGDQKNAQSEHQNQIDNMLKLFNFQLAAQKASNSSAPAQIFKGTSGPAGAANYLAQTFGGDQSNTAQQILQIINDTMADPNVVAGHHAQTDAHGKPQVDPITGKQISLSNNDQYVEDLLRNKMESSAGGYSTGDINSAINALLAYLGKLR